MSPSKIKHNLTDVARPPRNPKCGRCRNHGSIVPQKGHKRTCQFADCTCWKCSLVTQRTEIMALLQRRNTKSQKSESACPESRDGPRCEAAVDDGTLTVPGNRAQPEGTCGLMSPASAGAREEVAVKMRRFQDADGKTYAVLQDATIHEKTPREEGAPGPLSTPDLQRKPPPAGLEHMDDGTQLGPAKHWSRTQWAQDGPFGMNPNPPHFSRFGQREMYNSREVVAVPARGLPMRLFAHYPLLHYPTPAQPGPSGDGRGPFFVHPPSMLPWPCQEQLVLIQQPQLSLPSDREQGVDGQSLGK